jgi:hypothetical protein
MKMTFKHSLEQYLERKINQALRQHIKMQGSFNAPNHIMHTPKWPNSKELAQKTIINLLPSISANIFGFSSMQCSSMLHTAIDTGINSLFLGE